ncbi:MAG: hypothetical protein A3J28_16435 [Acidobacteria bacterium RIFCSPLOWO2_12_FULL_60_22]|nr:MAG: hypothetical protein A3J28_16435 [Acidobacteria bacterium RIFCSPLOWO2_12_FULL_60_22]
MSSVQPVTAEDIPKKLAEFVNTWPLYSPFVLRFFLGQSSPDLPQTILRECGHCEATPTWQRVRPYSYVQTDKVNAGVGWILAYQCTHCRKEELRLWVNESASRAKNQDGTDGPIVGVTWRKFGQWPAQSIEPSREVAKELTAPVLDIFKKGLTSLSHGFGLGALAYFRRVVEDASAELINLFAEKAKAEGDEEAEKAIRAAMETRRMEDRLKVASEALPATLRPGGANPLAVLYAHYSRGIHGLSDDECLEVARQLHFALDYIFKNWRTQMEEAAKFRATVKRWGDSTRTPSERIP